MPIAGAGRRPVLLVGAESEKPVEDSEVGEDSYVVLLDRTSAAPISWGVCEVPGWGLELPVERVLCEMATAGFTATELGSAGYLPSDPIELSSLLGRHGLTLSGAFVPLALHSRSGLAQTQAQARSAAELLAAAGGRHFITCIVSDPESWERPELTEDNWAAIAEGLRWVDGLCASLGIVQVLHPHVDSLIETAAEIQWVVDNTDVAFVLETGHFTIGGYDPTEFVELHADRIGLAHIKDVSLRVATRLNAGEISLMEAVQQGLFPPLGLGDIGPGKTIRSLEETGYSGWYVLEQDVAITGGEPPAGDGPLLGVLTSIEYLRSVESELAGPSSPTN
ncbi:MAG: TIM barrel protein [Actinomycetia bacterium]|nr:TIM barrel protein [Actinomycetes bacterium]